MMQKASTKSLKCTQYEEQIDLMQSTNFKKNISKSKLEILEILFNSVESYRVNIIQQIYTIINMITNQINFLQNCGEEAKITNLKSEDDQEKFQKFKKNILTQLIQLKQNNEIDQIIIQIKEFDQNIEELDLFEKTVTNYDLHSIKKPQEKIERYEYQICTHPKIAQKERCDAIAFNKDGSIFIAGADNLIKIFQFKLDKFQETQTIQGHLGHVSCLLFLKNSNQFLSGGDDTKIKIYQQKSENQWNRAEGLQGHKNWIYCIVSNKEEDLIISAGLDKSIIFWKLKNMKWNLEQKIECSSEIYSINYNDNNCKLICSEFNKTVSVIEQQKQKWIVTQKIKVTTEGYRLCFLNENEFVFQPWKGNQLFIYKYNEKNKIFQESSQLKVNDSNSDGVCFPIQFITSKNLLIVKHSNCLNVFSKLNNSSYKLDQTIPFETYQVDGCVSDDGEILITWDVWNKEFVIRKLNEGTS